MNRKIAHFSSLKTIINRLFLALSCIGLSLLTSCASVLPPCSAKTSPPSNELRSTKWVLVRWNLPPNARGEVRARQIPHGDNSNPIQIIFDANGERISGSTGCNRFTAQINEDARGFTFDQIASTKMTCSLERKELEQDFLYELKDYRSIVRNGDQLLMIGAHGEVLSFMQRSN